MLVTDRQRNLADTISVTLRVAKAEFREHVDTTSPEPVVRFDLRTPPGSGLRVAVSVLDDLLVFEANGASMRMELAAWPPGQDGEWIKDCVRTIQSLLSNPLRIRLRTSLFGRPVGAIWVPSSKGEGAWSGERDACLGPVRK